MKQKSGKMAKKKTKPKPPPRPEGRPSLYDPKYCEMLLTHLDAGLSFDAFGGLIGVTRQTLYNWAEVHPEFFDAKKKGELKSLLWWEKEGQKGLWDETEYNEQGKPIFKKSLNSTVWIFNMKNRHKWKDRHEIDLDATVKTSPLKEELKQKSVEELLALKEKVKKE